MDELMHVGILGMKWGRRKSRSGGSDSSSADHKTASSLKGKRLSEMSNEDLKKLTTRLQLEKQFKDLNKKEVGEGQKFVKEVLVGVAKQAATKYLAENLPKAGALLVDRIKKGG